MSAVKRITALVLICLFLLCGCERLKSEIESIQTVNEVSNQAETIKVVQTAQPVVVTPTDESINPLAAFYEDFKLHSDNGILTLKKAFLSAGKVPQHAAASALVNMETALYEAYISTGRLTYDSHGVYNGSVMGAANGSGTLTLSDEASFVMRFSYTDGRALYGIFSSDTLLFVSGTIPTGLTCCLIRKTDLGYEAEADINGKGAAIVINGNMVTFSERNFSQPTLQYGISQSDAPDLSLYDASYMNIDFMFSSGDYWKLEDGALEYVVSVEAATPVNAS